MHRQRNDPWTDQRVVLDLLITHYPAPWSVAELARAIAGGEDLEPSTVHAEDALRDLYGAGLVHRSGGLYLATRAAVEGARLAA